MTNYSKLVTRILDETIACQDSTTNQYKNRRTGRYAPFGPDIIGPNGGYPTTDAAMDAIARLADSFRGNDPALLRTSTRDSIRLLASRAFGDILNDLIRTPDPSTQWQMVRDRMRERIKVSGLELMHYIPVWLFIGVPVDGFSIGPVKFVTRSDFLDVVKLQGGGSSAWMELVNELWSGGTLTKGPIREGLRYGVRSIIANPLEPHKWIEAFRYGRKSGRPQDVHNADKIARIVHPDQWVACIEVTGFEREESRRRAVLAVRVALDTIRLVLYGRDRRLIRTVFDNVEPLTVDRVSQERGRDLALGWHFNRPGLSGTKEMAESITAAAAPLYAAAGECISAAVDQNPNGHPCPKLADRWFNAVHWFGRACQSDADFIAVVMLIISLDVLSGGKQDSGILELLARLTGSAISSQVLNDGTTLKQLVFKSYKLRSKVAHGSILALHNHMDEERDRLEEIASVALEAYAHRLSTYAANGGADDRDKFLASLPPAIS